MDNPPQESIITSKMTLQHSESGDSKHLQTIFSNEETVKKEKCFTPENKTNDSGGGDLSSLSHSDKSSSPISQHRLNSMVGQGDTTFSKNGLTFSAMPLLKQRLGNLWEKRMFTDVIFFVGYEKTTIEAHRVILASASEVFQQLLFNEGSKPLLYNDKYALYEDEFSMKAFEVFIKAMYTNEIPICLTLADALEVFYASKKYKVIFLGDQILEHIRQLLTVSNVFEALRLSTNAIELTYLAPICWKIIEEQTHAVLQYHFEDLDAYTLGKVLERDRLGMEEVDLFRIVVRWAASRCKAHEMKTTGKNKRHFLEPLIKHFRFTTMTNAEFNDVVVTSRVLDHKEIQHIQSTFGKGVDPKLISSLPYKTFPRINTANTPIMGESNAISEVNENHRIAKTGEVLKICSDSAVITPKLGSKLCTKGGGNPPRGKAKRITTRNKTRL